MIETSIVARRSPQNGFRVIFGFSIFDARGATRMGYTPIGTKIGYGGGAPVNKKVFTTNGYEKTAKR